MCFKDIYDKVNELKDRNLYSIMDDLGVNLVYQEYVPLNKQAICIYNQATIIVSNKLNEQQEKIVLLHELGHLLFDVGCHVSNHRTEENNANLFMCLYLVHNEIWDFEFFDVYLIHEGVDPKVARQFNDRVWQYKNQVTLGISY